MLVSEESLIDQLLAEQQSLSAVERFSQKHSGVTGHSQQRYYQDLIPLSRPKAGEQYAFAVDLDKCTGCKACVSACHSLNGLDQDEAWRDTGLLRVAEDHVAYQQTITTACHHCLDPACANGCPVLAYEKDEETGIVRHLDDQCIGCQYCILKCPYDVPKYNTKRGIVRKCDMCYQRLSVGEAPACVQACPSGAIAIQIVSQTHMVQEAERMLPGAFDSSYTRPTTSYTSNRLDSLAGPADERKLRVEHAHWPLVLMLVLTQAAVGLFLVNALLVHQPMASALAFLLLNVGLGCSVLHLGQPLKAWRAFLGWRKSWMSREIMAFSAFAGAAAMLTAMGFLDKIFIPEDWKRLVLSMAAPLPVLVIFAGLLAVFTSCMIYVDTRRPSWDFTLTGMKFFGTVLALGVSAAAFWRSEIILIAPVISGGMMVLEALLLTNPKLAKPKAILNGPLRDFQCARIILILGAICCYRSALAAFLVLLVAQILERACFFMAASAPRMPGSV